jgi:hypothetical protein
MKTNDLRNRRNLALFLHIFNIIYNIKEVSKEEKVKSEEIFTNDDGSTKELNFSSRFSGKRGG